MRFSGTVGVNEAGVDSWRPLTKQAERSRHDSKDDPCRSASRTS